MKSLKISLLSQEEEEVEEEDDIVKAEGDVQKSHRRSLVIATSDAGTQTNEEVHEAQDGEAQTDFWPELENRGVQTAPAVTTRGSQTEILTASIAVEVGGVEVAELGTQPRPGARAS